MLLCSRKLIGYSCSQSSKIISLHKVGLIRVRWSSQKPSDPWYKDAVKKYENYLETNHPKFYKLHRIVVDGSQSCYADLKIYFRVSSEIRNGKPLEQLTRKELENFVLTPADIEKLIIIVCIVALPMTIFILAAAVVFFPRLLLTRHFWTVDQTLEFSAKALAKRRQHYFSRVAHLFTAALMKSKIAKDISAFSKPLAASGVLPLQEQLKNSAIFRDPSVQIDKLPWEHQLTLGRSHGMVPLFNTAKRLEQRSDVIQALDKKLRDENLSSLPPLELCTSLLIRQINTENMTDDQRREALRNWLNFTSEPKPASWLLHAPVLAQIPKSKKSPPE